VKQNDYPGCEQEGSKEKATTTTATAEKAQKYIFIPRSKVN